MRLSPRLSILLALGLLTALACAGPEDDPDDDDDDLFDPGDSDDGDDSDTD